MNPLFLSGYGVKIKTENIRSSSNLTESGRPADGSGDRSPSDGCKGICRPAVRCQSH